MYSLVNTAKANGIDPFKYLCYLFEEMPNANTVDAVKKLLPWYRDSTEVLKVA